MNRASDAITWLPSVSGGPGPFPQVDRFRIGDVEFRCSFEHGSEPDRFYVRKDRGLVESFLEVLDRFPDANVVELGIMEGGSTALAALAAEPRKLVAFELRPDRVTALDALIERRGLARRVRPYYGVDQSDRKRLRAIVAEEFGDEQVDLVVDDASHRLEPTRASFETLFPRLREGGMYLIEDWRWQISRANAVAEKLRDPDPEFKARFERRLRRRLRRAASEGAEGATKAREAPLPQLVVELILAKAESEEYVSEVTIGPWWVAVRRGGGDLDTEAFRLAELYTDRMGLLHRASAPTIDRPVHRD
jgi:predicted O-methyltransferase YrrM